MNVLANPIIQPLVSSKYYTVSRLITLTKKATGADLERYNTIWRLKIDDTFPGQIIDRRSVADDPMQAYIDLMHKHVMELSNILVHNCDSCHGDDVCNSIHIDDNMFDLYNILDIRPDMTFDELKEYMLNVYPSDVPDDVDTFIVKLRNLLNTVVIDDNAIYIGMGDLKGLYHSSRPKFIFYDYAMIVEQYIIDVNNVANDSGIRHFDAKLKEISIDNMMRSNILELRFTMLH